MCGRSRPYERFGGRGYAASVCSDSRQHPKDEQQRILATDEILRFLEQSNISLRDGPGSALGHGPEGAMIAAVVEEKRDEIRELCRSHRVKRLDLFGSASKSREFDPRTSDLDFLVEFEPLACGEHADAYFGLLEGLEDLFGRPVDLVVARAIRNPFFRQSIDRRCHRPGIVSAATKPRPH